MSKPLSKEEFELGTMYLKSFLKKIEIEVDGNLVKLIQVFEMPDHDLAVSFAKSLKATFEGG